MTKKEREQIDYIISHSITGTISWSDLISKFSEEVIKSDAMEEILLELDNNQIQVIEPEFKVNKAEYDDYTFVSIEVYKFKECIPEIRKYENGDFFADYLEGISVKKIAENNKLDLKEISKKIKTFASYIECREIENKYLPVFLLYDISRSDAMLILHLDNTLYRYLYLKSSLIPKEKIKNYTIPETLKSIVAKLKLKEIK